MLAHLRRNAVAYLALFVALSTGTSYAAGLAKNSVGTAQLKKNAVTSPKIKNGTIKADDLAAGLLGSGGGSGIQSFALTRPGIDPVANPDGQQMGSYEFTASAPGKAYVRLSYSDVNVDCSAGSPQLGLYLDGQPVPDTGVDIADNVGSVVEMVGLPSVTAGNHEFEVFPHCGPADFVSWGGINLGTWTIFVLPN